jgi:hypothetical protein
MTVEEYGRTERVLLSYDVSGIARPRAARVCHIVFGRIRRSEDGKPEKIERGFVHRPGVVWVGQSVLILPRRDADELAARLRTLGVRVGSAQVTVAVADLRAFRRPR